MEEASVPKKVFRALWSGLLGSEFAQCMCDSTVEQSSSSEYLVMSLHVLPDVCWASTATKTKGGFELAFGDTVLLALQA